MRASFSTRLRLASLRLAMAAVLMLSGRAAPGVHAQATAATQAPIAPVAQPPVIEAHADIPGARLFYIDTGGTGFPVVLMHAGTGSSRVWEYQLPAFTAAGYRVIAYDRRGYGRTTASESGPVGTAADDLEALMTYLKIDRFHLVGTAAGGIVSFDYVLAYPHRLRSLTVANSLGGAVDREYQEMSQRLRPKEFNTLPPDFRELGPAYRAANPEGTKRWLDLEHLSRAPGPRPPAQPAKNRVTFELLETIKVPTLLITGDADLYTPPPALRLFANRIRGAVAVMMREVGHSAYWEQPELFNRTVLDFIRKH